MAKKICAVTTVEGTQRSFMIPALRHLKENGWDVTLICNMSDDFIKVYEKEFHLINIPFKRGISLRDLILKPFELKRIFKAHEFDIVQYATPNASVYASIGAWLAKITIRVYCQWGIRYVGSFGIMRRILKLMEKTTCKCSTHIRPASWKNLEFSISEGLYDRSKAKAIGDGGTVGIDLKIYDVRKKSEYRDKILESHPVLKDKFIFVFVGRFNKDKGIDELIESFLKIQKDNDKVALLLIGAPDGALPKMYDQIKSNPNVIRTGYIQNVQDFLSCADVMVHPSYREGFSMVIQQGMALGLPIITTDIPGPSEVIENNISGILVKPRDTESLYKAMKWIIDHPEDRSKMGVSGLNRCRTKFSRERMLRLTLEDREEIIGNFEIDI